MKLSYFCNCEYPDKNDFNFCKICGEKGIPYHQDKDSTNTWLGLNRKETKKEDHKFFNPAGYDLCIYEISPGRYCYIPKSKHA